MSDMCVFLGEYHISYIVGIVLVHLLVDAEKGFLCLPKDTKYKVKLYSKLPSIHTDPIVHTVRTFFKNLLVRIFCLFTN